MTGDLTPSPRPGPSQIGFWMATALVVGNMIGSGLFLLPSALAPYAADNLPGWLLTAAGGMALGLVFGLLSRAVPGAGGPYAYTREAFGDLAGFTVGWSYWVSVWVGNAAIATAGIGYAGEFFPWMVRTPFQTAVATLAVVWAFTFVNCIGIRAAGWVQGITTLLKLLPLVAAVALLGQHLPAIAWPRAGGAHFTLGGTVAVATLAAWAMLGLESATIPADKVKGSGTIVLRATVWGTAFTVVISAAVCAAVLLLVPAAKLSSSSVPFAELVRIPWGEGAARAVSLFAAISALGALNGWTLLQGELPCAMARDGLFVRSFGRTTARGTPVAALVGSSVLVTGLVLLNFNRTLVGVFTFFVLLATTSTLFAYLACSLALVRLRGRDGSTAAAGRAAPPSRRVTSWLAMLGCAGALYSIGTLAGAGKEAVFWGIVLLLAGLPMYAVINRRKESS